MTSEGKWVFGAGGDVFNFYGFLDEVQLTDFELRCSLPVAAIFTLVLALTRVKPWRLGLSPYT